MFDVSSPAEPRELGRYLTPGVTETALLVDSVAYVEAYSSTHDTVIHAVDVSDPSNPVIVGAAGGWRGPEAMVIQDSLLYAAEPYRFEVFSVANPRQPVWRGRCNSLDLVLCGLDVQGQYAYEIAGPFGLAIISIADPANPSVASTTRGHPTYAVGVAVRDTFAYVPSAYETLYVHSVADPALPRVIGGAAINDGGGYDICLRDSYAFLGCVDFHVFDISSPAQPVRAGFHESPYRAFAVTCDSNYIYVACYLAGVAVYEVLPVGLAEPKAGRLQTGGSFIRVTPNPVRTVVRLAWFGSNKPRKVAVRDVTGRAVLKLAELAPEDSQLSLDLSHLKSGVYFVEAEMTVKTASAKLVKH